MVVTQGLVVESRRKLKASKPYQSLVIAQLKLKRKKQRIEKRLTNHKQLNKLIHTEYLGIDIAVKDKVLRVKVRSKNKVSCAPKWSPIPPFQFVFVLKGEAQRIKSCHSNSLLFFPPNRRSVEVTTFLLLLLLCLGSSFALHTYRPILNKYFSSHNITQRTQMLMFLMTAITLLCNSPCVLLRGFPEMLKLPTQPIFSAGSNWILSWNQSASFWALFTKFNVFSFWFQQSLWQRHMSTFFSNSKVKIIGQKGPVVYSFLSTFVQMKKDYWISLYWGSQKSCVIHKKKKKRILDWILFAWTSSLKKEMEMLGKLSLSYCNLPTPLVLSLYLLLPA